METLQWLREDSSWFPPSYCALEDPNGLLAVGGDLSPNRLLAAYRRGIFPWYDKNQPILWWTPNPRMVIYPNAIHRSRSFKKHLRSCGWNVTLDKAFDRVIEECAAPRDKESGTWITRDIDQAYKSLHKSGYGHSVEVWDEEETLVGGLYGVAIGKVFFGESMFSRRSNGSKVAISCLCYWLKKNNFELLDCQIENPHLVSLGAENIRREYFESLLKTYCSATNEHLTQTLMNTLKHSISQSWLNLDLHEVVCD